MYKLTPDAKKWEKEMFAKAKMLEKKAPHDIYHLYIELEKISDKYLKNGEMSEGDIFSVPFKDGSFITLSFNLKTTSIIRHNINGTEDKLLFHKDGPEKEKDVLILLSNTYLNTGFGIGEQYPNEMLEIISQADIGDIITFSDKGKMYVCSRNDKDGRKVFQQMHTKPFSENLEDFKTFDNLAAAHS